MSTRFPRPGRRVRRYRRPYTGQELLGLIELRNRGELPKNRVEAIDRLLASLQQVVVERHNTTLELDAYTRLLGEILPFAALTLGVEPTVEAVVTAIDAIKVQAHKDGIIDDDGNLTGKTLEGRGLFDRAKQALRGVVQSLSLVGPDGEPIASKEVQEHAGRTGDVADPDRGGA